MIKKRISQFLRILKGLARNPRILLIDGYYLITDLEKKDYVVKKYKLPLGLPTINLLDLSPNFNETVNPYSYLSQTSLPIDLSVLKLLAKKYKNCRYLEIGTWRGESLANVADVAKECVSISLSDAELRKWGNSEEYIALQRFFSKNIKNIKHIKHNSHTFDFSTFKSKFDLIFIDGDHTYEGVKMDTINAFKSLRDKDSVIVWHDCGKTLENTNWPVLAGILDGCPKEKRKFLYRVSNTLLAIYFPKKIKSEYLKFPQIPNKNFKININAKKLVKISSSKSI